MTDLELLEALEQVPEAYLVEAQRLRQRKSRIRPAFWLAAALLALLLAGCVAYVLNLRDYSLGREGPVWDMVSGLGRRGEACFEAQKEWLHYEQAHVTGGIPNVSDDPEIPNAYEYIYGCYDGAMVEKLESLLDEYDLLPLEPPLTVQREHWAAAEAALGLEKLWKPGVQILGCQGMFYPPENFGLSFDLILEGSSWPIRLSHGDKAYLPQMGYWLMDLENAEQWMYRTDDMVLLLAIGESGTILADRPGDSFFLQVPSKNLDRQQLEAIADCFDFSAELNRADVRQLTSLLDNRAQQESSHEREGSFDDAVKELVGFHMDRLSYAFYDVTGDGKQELVIFKDGEVRSWYREEKDLIIRHDGENTEIPDLAVQPLPEYPLEGGTLNDFARQADTPQAPEKVRTVYQEILAQVERNHYTHYGIADINGDGVEDLLLSGDGEQFWSAYTWRYGKKITLIWSDFLLCENSVLQLHSTNYSIPGQVTKSYRFVILGEDGEEKTVLDALYHDRKADVWRESKDGPVISYEEAQAVFDRYPVIPNFIQPIP